MPGRKPEGAHTVATAAAVSYRTGRGKSKRLERRAAKIRGHMQRAGTPQKKEKRGGQQRQEGIYGGQVCQKKKKKKRGRARKTRGHMRRAGTPKKKKKKKEEGEMGKAK